MDTSAELRDSKTSVTFCPDLIPSAKDAGIKVKAHFKINNIWVTYPDHINFSDKGRLCWYSKEAKWACIMECHMVYKSIVSNIETKMLYI